MLRELKVCDGAIADDGLAVADDLLICVNKKGTVTFRRLSDNVQLAEVRLGEPSWPVSSVGSDGRIHIDSNATAAAVVWGRRAFVFDLKRLALVSRLSGHSDFVTDCCFDRHGQRVLTSGADGTVRLWDAFSGRELLTIKVGQKSIFSVAFVNDERAIITGGEESLTLFEMAARNNQPAATTTDQ